jgi:GDPmannose 4,6-dehydratase
MILKKALITGVTGQVGSYLAELLLQKGYQVHGLIRRNSDFTSKRINHLFGHKDFHVHHGDMVDASNLYSVLSQVNPDEIYNLAAQSHVALSFKIPEYSSNVDGIGVLRLLAGVKDLGLSSKVYQASTSELFGGIPGTTPQNENTPFAPRSPYAASKLFAYWIVKNYREAYKIFASNGILFNHESPRRGKTFVTKKITRDVARIAKGNWAPIRLGNLDAKRDWGYAKEYAEAIWLILQQESPDDYVVGTGHMHSVRYFVEYAFKCVDIDLEWKGNGVHEVGIDKKTNRVLVQIDPEFYRPLEVDELCADPSKARAMLGWESQLNINELIELMVGYDLKYDEYGHPDDEFSKLALTPIGMT